MGTYLKALLQGAILLILPQTALAVRIDLDNAIVAENGTATLTVTLHSEGNVVAGFQNDILFDTRVVNLPNAGRCTVDPGIGVTSPGCNEDPPVGLCLTLNRDLRSCGSVPTPSSCEGQPPYVSRLRVLMADLATFPPREIPDGSVLYRCVFDVVDPDGLPASLKNLHLFAGDPAGMTLQATGADGSISADGSVPPTWTPAPTPTPGSPGDPCQTDLDCATSNCNWGEPQGAYSGTCEDARTPTPEVPAGCTSNDDCAAAGLYCNADDGVCCDQPQCAPGQSCSLYGHVGTCMGLPTPTPTPKQGPAVIIYYSMTEPDESGRFVLSARLEGEDVIAMQGDIIFSERAFRLAGTSACRINPEIGDRRAECEDYPPEVPCLTLITNVQSCGDPSTCYYGRPPDEVRLRTVLRGLDTTNRTTISSGTELFSCAFQVNDASLLPAEMLIFNLLAASSTAQALTVEPRTEQGINDLDKSILTVEASGSSTTGGGGHSGCALSDESRTGGLWLLAFAAVFVLGYRDARLRSKSY